MDTAPNEQRCPAWHVAKFLGAEETCSADALLDYDPAAFDPVVFELVETEKTTCMGVETDGVAAEDRSVHRLLHQCLAGSELAAVKHGLGSLVVLGAAACVASSASDPVLEPLADALPEQVLANAPRLNGGAIGGKRPHGIACCVVRDQGCKLPWWQLNACLDRMPQGHLSRLEQPSGVDRMNATRTSIQTGAAFGSTC
jgi:hypothetical protein